jgi:Domain of unknown function (DUF4209)
MNIPDWVQQILTDFESRTEPHNEVQISDALRLASNAHQDMSEADFKGYHAEWAAFLFLGHAKEEDSVWGTYFVPMATIPRTDGTEFRSPDIANFDADVVNHWEHRARSVHDPVMQARYADLVWDLKRVIAPERQRPHEFAKIAIAAYLDATNKRLYTMDIEAVWWLKRALSLSLSLGNEEMTRTVVESILKFRDKVAEPQRAGVWIFPFDALYGKKGLLTPEQEAKIVADLETMLARTSSSKPDEFDPHGAQAAAERLAQHYKRQNDRPNVQRVIKIYGETFERLSKDAAPMLAMAWLQPVLERYEQEGLKDEAERLQLLHAEKGKNIKDDLKEISTTVEIKKEDIDRQVEEIIGSGNLRTSLKNVAVTFIPRANRAREFLEKMRAEAPLLSMFSVNILASDGHTSATIGSVDQDPDGRLHRELGQIMGYYQPFLVLTLERMRERYKPSVDDIFGFLAESPLFANCEKGLLRDGLEAYEREDFVKAIHVLVPQIEHILRNFLGMLGIPMLKTVRNHQGIMDAKSMNDILSDERMREILTEDLWRYLTVLYIDKKGGLNLRNDLAHGLLPSEAFSRSTADRVFHSLLTLSLLRIRQPKAEEESQS